MLTTAPVHTLAGFLRRSDRPGCLAGPVLAGLLAAAAVALPAPPARAGEADGITAERSRTDPRRYAGRTTVGAPPASILRSLADVPAWPRLFSDVRRLEVESRAGNTWEVELDSVILDCEHGYRIVVLPGGRVSLFSGVAGTVTDGMLVVAAGPTPGTSIVSFDLFIEASGVLGWFISDETLRAMQERVVRAYLLDLRRAFPAPPVR